MALLSLRTATSVSSLSGYTHGKLTQKGYTEPWHIIHINEYAYDPMCTLYACRVFIHVWYAQTHTH